MHCTKAIITTAGFGTRRLPITKAVEKCMIPVGNRPIVDYAVQDCIKAGITDIILVVGEQADQIRTYYGQNEPFETYLKKYNKHEMLEAMTSIGQGVKFTFVVQDRTQPYGTTVPLHLVQDLIEPGETFLYLYGDNIFFSPEGHSQVAELLRAAEAADTPGAMLAVEVPHDQVYKYGIVATEKHNDIELYREIVEKPKVEDAPSNLNNAGCFLLDSNIFPYIERSMSDESPQEEKYVIDSVNWYSQDGNEVAVVRASAEWLDCGTLEGWLYANNRVVYPDKTPIL